MSETDGPAPDVGERRRYDAVECSVAPPDGGSELSAAFQPWVGGGAVYVAWRVGAETGPLGVLDREAEVVRLGERGYPEGDGRYRRAVDLSAATAERLDDVAGEGRLTTQSPSATVRRLDRSEIEVEADYAAPAPPDAAETGDVHIFTARWWAGQSDVVVCQPWRPPDAGAAYVAVDVYLSPERDLPVHAGLTADRAGHAVLDGRAVRLGRRPGLRWVFFLWPAAEDSLAALRSDVGALAVTDRTLSEV